MKESNKKDQLDLTRFDFHPSVASYSGAWTRTGYQHLRTFLSRVAVGDDSVYTAPFAKGQSMSQVLSDWQDILVSIRDEWPTLWDFEIDLARKVGPMSVMKPLKQRLADVNSYYADILLSAEPVHGVAIDAVLEEFASARGLRQRSQRNVIENMDLSKSSGSPFMSRKREVVPETLDSVVRTRFGGRPIMPLGTVVSTLPNYSSKEFDSAAILGWRGQEGGPKASDVKQRVVWMFPFNINVNELQVYQPLIESCQKLGLVPAWISNEAVDTSVTRLFDTKDDADLVVCTDFSRFDQHFNAQMQDAAKSILRGLCSRGPFFDKWFKEVFPVKYCIPMAIATERVGGRGYVQYVKGLHGMASGSGGTNADETLAHRALQHEVAILHGKKLNPFSMCLGDDGILSYPGISIEDVRNAYESHGQVCNPDKQYASASDCVYLRRWHHKDYRLHGICVGVYSTCRALGRLRYLERYMDPDVWSKEMVALRQLSILENVKYHPLKEQFVQFCMDRDKYRLGIDIPGFLDGLAKFVSEATDYMPDFLGYTRTQQGGVATDVSEWWIVRYLKSQS